MKRRKRLKSKPDTLDCNHCKEVKPYTSEFFPRSKQRKFGLDYLCLECNRVLKRKNSAKNNTNRRESVKKKVLKNKSEGLCTKCNLVRLPDSNLFCEKHFLQNLSHKILGTKKEWGYLKELIEKQKYKCFYSGVDLVLGLNASVDHTKASSKFPELKHSKDNVNWVDIRVNRMKRELDEQEFIDLCRSIIFNFPPS